MNNMQVVFVPSTKLRETSRKVNDSEFGEELEEYMNKMLTKMYELNGAGLAGVQVGDSRRLLVADAGSRSIIMVNPEFVEKSEETIQFQEGCLSLPGFQLDTERSERVKVRYNTPLGEEQEEEFSGIESVVVQHEMDHLDGITLLEKVSRLKRNMYVKKINKFKRRIKRRIEQSSQVYY
jgi:peptide deformylase